MLIDERSKLTRAAAGQLVEGGPPEVVFVAGDVIGPLKWFERRGDLWVAHDLLGEDVIHGHTLELADIDGDGHLDIFCRDGQVDRRGDATRPSACQDVDLLRRWPGGIREVGDRHGDREPRVAVADLDGDGDLDIVGKPYGFGTPRLDIWLNRGTDPGNPKTGR